MSGTTPNLCPTAVHTEIMPRIKAASLEEHHELVWRDITNALSELLEERDYENINLGHIAERSGIARNTLYRYAPDKTALMIAIAHRASAPVVGRIIEISHQPLSATERVRLIIAELIHAFASTTIRLMLQPSMLKAIPTGVIEHPEGPFGVIAQAMEKVIAEGVAADEFRISADEQLTAWLLSGVVRSAADRVMHEQHSPEQLIPIVQDLVTSALQPHGTFTARSTPGGAIEHSPTLA